MKLKIVFYEGLFIIMLCAMMLQDLFLQNYFGTIARCPVVFIAPAVFFVMLLVEKKVSMNTISIYYLRYAVAGILAALLMLGITLLFVTNMNMHVYDEQMPVKLIKASFYNITYFIAIYVLINLSKYITLHFIYRCLLVAFLFLFALGIVQYFLHIRLPLINTVDTGEIDRIPLTASEPSLAAAMVVIISGLLIAIRLYEKKTFVYTGVIAVMALILLVLVGSRAIFIFMPLAVLWAIRKKISLKILMYAAIIIIPVIFILVGKIIPSLMGDVENFNSMSTRSTTWLAAMESLIRYPFGEGYGTYMVYFPKLLFPVNEWLVQVTGIPLLDYELKEMVSTGINLSAKAGIPMEIVNNGFICVVFLFYISRYYKRMLAYFKNNALKIMLLFLGSFLFLEFLFNVVLETAYIYLLVFVVIEKMAAITKQKNIVT